MMLEGKTALVTGCNRGIGRSILEVFAQNGANIWAAVRQTDDSFCDYLRSLEHETGVTITPLAFDLNNHDEIKAAIKTIQSTKKPIDVLVNNAGIIATSLFQMTPLQTMKEVFEVNYFSQMMLTQYILKFMSRQKNSSIINISSIAATSCNEGMTAYASSKAAISAATKVLSKELAASHIRVNAIAPGLIQTDMMEQNTSEKVLKSTLNRTCLKRIGDPKEVANAALFLASDLSSYITGQVLCVDGGM